mgnify:CR=1 FL=1
MGTVTRKVLTWRLSNTMDAEFCIDALTRYGTPPRFTEVLEERQIRISMDGSDG